MNFKIFFLFSIFLVGCQGGKDKTNIELIQDMMDQTSYKSQEGTAEGKAIVRVPPKHTVPRGYKPYPYSKGELKKAASLKNPYRKNFSVEFLEQGKKQFYLYCAVCHGVDMGGKGTVAEKMIIRPPSLLTTKTKKRTDGELFHIITRGLGVMGAYSTQIRDEKSRWAIINYIRLKQKGDE